MLKQIFIIDDDQVSIFLAEAMLEHMGYKHKVESFLDPEKALPCILQKLQQNPEAEYLIFLDLNMPVMSGWDFLDELLVHAADLRDRCYIVILSAAIDGREIDRCLQHPLTLNFVPKPLDETAFELITEMLQRKDFMPAIRE